LRYAYPFQAPAYAPPLLTRRFIVIAGGGPQLARVRIYEREASTDSNAARSVFALEGGRVAPECDFTPTGMTRYRVPVALALRGGALLVSTPFGSARLVAHDASGGDR